MQPEIAGVELNLACPDRGRGGEPIGLDVAAAETATVAARAATDLPLIVKLTAGGAGRPGHRPRRGGRRRRRHQRHRAAAGARSRSRIAARQLGTAYGGLSGPAIKPVGLRVVYEIAQVVRVPVIGCRRGHQPRRRARLPRRRRHRRRPRHRSAGGPVPAGTTGRGAGGVVQPARHRRSARADRARPPPLARSRQPAQRTVRRAESFAGWGPSAVPEDAPRQAESTSSMAARSSSPPTMPSNLAKALPSASTTKR